jgi:hypothetical protein
MEVLLQKAIEINSTTILPNFGAFMKMGKSVLFNEFLKYDDGKLVKVVADLEKISEEDAKTKISKWIEDVNAKLNSGGSVTIPNLGVLEKDNGKIKFTATSGSKATPEPVVKAVEVKETPKEPVPVPEKTKVEEEKKPVQEIKPEVKPVEKKPAAPINISTDFSAQDAIEKIKAFTIKNDLIAFTREDKRKTVIDALNKKLDTLNGKVSAPIKEEKVETPVAPVKPKEKKEEVKTTPVAPVLNTKVETKKDTVKEDVTPPITNKEKDVEPPVETKPEVKKEEKVIPVVVEKVEVKKEEEKQPEVTPDTKPKEEPKKEKKPFPEKEIDEKAIAAIASSVEKTEKQLKKRKRRKLVLWLAIICLLIGGGLIGFLKKDVIMAYFDKKHEPKELADNTEEHKEEENEAIENETNEVSDEIVADEIVIEEEEVPPVTEEVVEEIQPVDEIVEEVEEVEEVVPVVSNSSSEGNYHIVAGSFSSEENANNKVDKLKSEGYNSAKVLGQYGGLYTVRAMSFTSKSEAKEALKEFKASGNKGFVKKL